MMAQASWSGPRWRSARCSWRVRPGECDVSMHEWKPSLLQLPPADCWLKVAVEDAAAVGV